MIYPLAQIKHQHLPSDYKIILVAHRRNGILYKIEARQYMGDFLVNGFEVKLKGKGLL